MQIIWTGSHEINRRYRSAYLSSPRRLGRGTGIALSNIPGIRRYCRAIPTKSGIRYDKNPSGVEPPSRPACAFACQRIRWRSSSLRGDKKLDIQDTGTSVIGKVDYECALFCYSIPERILQDL